VGINVARTVTIGFFLAGALAGAGGELYALYYTVVTWDHALRLTLIALPPSSSAVSRAWSVRC
jgi:branched-subunit amino acid ABC-type transport system permease component